MSRLTWEEARDRVLRQQARMNKARSLQRVQKRKDAEEQEQRILDREVRRLSGMCIGSPHYVEGKKAKKWNEHYYRLRYGYKKLLRELAAECAENPSETFEMRFNVSPRTNQARQAFAMQELQKLGVDGTQIHFGGEAEDAAA